MLNDDRADWREAWALFPGEVAYVWHGALHATTVAESLEACGFAIRSQIIWAKERLVLSRGDYHWQHEPCWYAVREKGKGHWNGDRKQTTLWQIPSRDQDATTVHGTQKPVECMRRPMLNNSSPGQAVYEPFSGSGTTIIAAETCGRICLSMELDPAYVDVAVLRWQAFTGEAATLDGDGRSFAEIAAERGARESRPAPEADGDPAHGRQSGQAGLEPRRARAAGRAAALSRASLARRAQGVAPGRPHPARHGGADQHRPRRARRLLPVLRPLGRGGAEAEGDPGAAEDALGLRAAEPWLAIANKQLELMGRYMTELGMTPAARSRVAVEDPRMQLPVTHIFRTIYEAKPDSVIEAVALPVAPARE